MRETKILQIMKPSLKGILLAVVFMYMSSGALVAGLDDAYDLPGYGITLAARPHSEVNAHETDSLESKILNEVVVSGYSPTQRIGNVRLGAEKLEMTVFEKTPMLFREVDIIKSITLLPGVVPVCIRAGNIHSGCQISVVRHDCILLQPAQQLQQPQNSISRTLTLTCLILRIRSGLFLVSEYGNA